MRLKAQSELVVFSAQRHRTALTYACLSFSGQWDGYMSERPFVIRAIKQLKIATHKGHVALANSKAKTRTTKATCGCCVGLREFVKNLVTRLFWDAHASIGYGDYNRVVLIEEGFDINTTNLGELHCITNNICQHLSEFLRVTTVRAGYVVIVNNTELY